jgi:hypothetical protein
MFHIDRTVRAILRSILLRAQRSRLRHPCDLGSQSARFGALTQIRTGRMNRRLN